MKVYKLLSYVGIIFFTTQNFVGGTDVWAVQMEAETARFFFSLALSATLFGAILFLADVPKSQKLTLYEKRQTGPEYSKRNLKLVN